MSEIVHVITDLGPTDGPGLLVDAELLGAHINGHRIFYYDPPGQPEYGTRLDPDDNPFMRPRRKR